MEPKAECWVKWEMRPSPVGTTDVLTQTLQRWVQCEIRPSPIRDGTVLTHPLSSRKTECWLCQSLPRISEPKLQSQWVSDWKRPMARCCCLTLLASFSCAQSSLTALCHPRQLS